MSGYENYAVVGMFPFWKDGNFEDFMEELRSSVPDRKLDGNIHRAGVCTDFGTFVILPVGGSFGSENSRLFNAARNWLKMVTAKDGRYSYVSWELVLVYNDSD